MGIETGLRLCIYTRAYLNRKLIDFSNASTVPHAWLIPEFIVELEEAGQLYDGSRADEEYFDIMIDDWNAMGKRLSTARIWNCIRPNWDYKEDILR